MKKLLLSLLLLAGVLQTAFAYDFSAVAPSGQTLYYTIVDGNVQVTSQNSSSPRYTTYPSGALNIPSSVNNNGTTYLVASIGDHAFSGCMGLSSVTIPNTVTHIGSGAFWNCEGLSSVTIPNTVTSIDSKAFSCCYGLTSITISNNVTTIGNEAFYGCSSLTSIAIPNDVTTIGNEAFYGCSSLTSIAIPNNVTTIGNKAFYGCSGLTTVTIGNSVSFIGDQAFNNCNLTSVYYTGDVAGWCGIEFYSVVSNPLYNANNLYINNTLVTNLVIPNSVTEIKQYAFSGATCITSVTIPNSVIAIGRSAFGACTGLTTVTIGNSVVSIGNQSFYGCSGLTTVTIPNSVTSIENSAFYNCNSLTSLTIGNSVTSIGIDAFYGCSSLTGTLTIPNSVTSIGGSAFYNCSGLTSLTIGNSVTSIGIGAFYGCSSLTGTLTIPNSVTSIGGSAFYNCNSLTSLTIGNSVTSIGIDAFYCCSSLTGTLTIPNSVTSIGGSAFYGCSGLTEIHSLNPVPPTVGTNAFHGIPNNTPVYIPCGRLSYYTAADGWSSFTNFIENSAASFSAVSNDNLMGSVQILTMPTCTNPQAVVYAVANSGYQFDHWSDNSTSNPYSLTVNEDMELTAYFSPIGSQPTTYYNITVTANDAEMGTVTGGGSFAEGTTTTITATANSGYHFVQWQDGNTEASRSITVTVDAEYTAYFAANGANDYTITVMAQNPSMGTTTGSGTFAYGTATTITAEPYEGYYFVQWNDGNTQRIRTITVTGNATYTAYFDRSNGIDDIASDQIKIYSRGSEIVIEGANDTDALIYDVMGRIVHKGRIESPIRVSNTGVYMVKIGNRQPQKVVVR